MNDSIFASNKKEPIDNEDAGLEKDLFTVLLDMFNNLGLIDEGDDQDPNKFAFIQAFPDQPYDQNNVITFNIIESRPFTNKSSVAKQTTMYKPVYNNEYYDVISGNSKSVYKVLKKECLELRCFSTSSRTCQKMATLLETIFITQTGVISQAIKNHYHISTSGVKFIGDYENKRLFSSAVYYELVVEKRFSTDLEQLKNVILTTNN